MSLSPYAESLDLNDPYRRWPNSVVTARTPLTMQDQVDTGSPAKWGTVIFLAPLTPSNPLDKNTAGDAVKGSARRDEVGDAVVDAV